ncbi:MAG: GTP-binding protein [Phycisphaerales bacterium]|nr:MAG: GTP-binding protein [Phycisphaerales bacterium]
MQLDETILAIASPPGRAARGLLRLSGPQTFELLSRRIAGRDICNWPPPRGVHRARYRLGALALPLLMVAYRSPHSYTGEDGAELLVPGNPVLLARLVDDLLEAGTSHRIAVRRAEPGEFTARAYFTGRISLTEAEGVAATISATSDAALRAASMLRRGALGRLAQELVDQLATALALVEAGIDFTDEEDVVAIAPDDLHERITQMRATIDQQLDRAVGMEQLDAIPWVVLTGPPNAGKSTLFNALLGRERAVVSDVAGTTRDVLTEPLMIDTPHGGAEIMLVDLAGLDATPDRMNQQMQRQAREAIDRAELLLDCYAATDASRGPLLPEDARVVRILTKVDLAPGTSTPPDALGVSGETGEGLDQLRALLSDRLASRAVSLSGDVLALTPRHEAELRAASGHLAEALELIAPARGQRHFDDPELIAVSLRAALDALGELGGEMTPDDVLGRVFASFCVGK